METLAGAIACVLLVGGILAHWRARSDEVLVARNIPPSPVKNTSTASARDLSDIPPEALRPQPPMAAGYNAHSGGLPPGALPPGVVLPGMPMMQGGRTTAQGYGVYDGIRQQFTGKERDGETGLDYFGARYYSSAQGRFTSVDPENASADVSDPQSWNGYAYARNNPLKYVDPDGREYKVCDNSGQCWTHWDPNFKPVLKNTDAAKADGITFKGNMTSGTILDADGNQIGTYKWVGQDYWSNSTNQLISGELPNRLEPVRKTALVAGIVAAAPILPTLVPGGGGLTTLGTIGRVAGPAAGSSGAVLNQLSRTDAGIFQRAAQYGASATNSFWNNLQALTQAVRSVKPDGQVNKIGQIGDSIVWGSVQSRVGIAEVDGVTVVVKMVRGTPKVLGPMP